MSTETPLGFQATDLPDAQTDTEPYRAQNVLKTIVWKELPYEALPLWYERDQAAWAIADTIQRVAPEVS